MSCLRVTKKTAKTFSLICRNMLCCGLVFSLAWRTASAQDSVPDQVEVGQDLVNRAVQDHKKTELLVLEASTEINRESFGNLLIPCGIVDQGQNVKVLLTVKNSMAEAFHFDAAVPSCSCTFFDSPAMSINSGESVVMEFRFKSSLDPISREQRASVKLLREGQEIGFLIPSCGIRFGISFELGNHSLLLGGPLAEYRIPFFYSDPIAIEELEVSVASGFEKTELGFLIKPVAEGHGYVAVLAKEVANDRGFDSGVLRLEHKPSGRYAETTVLTSQKPDMELVPENLYFSRITEGPNTGLYAASALVRVNSISTVQGNAEGTGVRNLAPGSPRDPAYIADNELDDEEKEAERSRILAEEAEDPEVAKIRQKAKEQIKVSGVFDVEGEPHVESQQIGKTVVRLRVIAKRNQLKENKSIDWHVTRAGIQFTIVSGFSIQE